MLPRIYALISPYSNQCIYHELFCVDYKKGITCFLYDMSRAAKISCSKKNRVRSQFHLSETKNLFWVVLMDKMKIMKTTSDILLRSTQTHSSSKMSSLFSFFYKMRYQFRWAGSLSLLVVTSVSSGVQKNLILQYKFYLSLFIYFPCFPAWMKRKLRAVHRSQWEDTKGTLHYIWEFKQDSHFCLLSKSCHLLLKKPVGNLPN